LTALYVHIAKQDKVLIEQACSIFAGPLDEGIPFTAALKKSFLYGGADYLRLNLHREYRRILKLARSDDPGSLLFNILLLSSLRAACDAINQAPLQE
jgi:hypothetical protein